LSGVSSIKNSSY